MATWSGTSKNLWLIGVVLLLDATLIVALSDVGFMEIAMLTLLFLTVVNFSFVRVEATPEEVRVSYLSGWPSRQIPRDDITAVTVKDVRAREFGGWGMRNGKVFHARSGPGIEIASVTHGTVVATVDDPQELVDVLQTPDPAGLRGSEITG